MKSDRIRHEIEQEFYPDGQMKRYREFKEPIINDFLVNFVGGMVAIAIVLTMFAIVWRIYDNKPRTSSQPSQNIVATSATNARIHRKNAIN